MPKKNIQIQDTITISAHQRKTVHNIFSNTVEFLEKYIEIAGYYDDWEQRKQIHNNEVVRKDIAGDPEKAEKMFSITLFGFRQALENKPEFFRNELKEEFYRWVSATGIDSKNAHPRLKNNLFGFHEILEGRGEKIMEDVLNRKDRLDVNSPDYAEKLNSFYAAIQVPLEKGREQEKLFKGKSYRDIKIEKKFGVGDDKQGKYTFNQISESIEDYQNFHHFKQQGQQQSTSSGSVPPSVSLPPNDELDKIVQEVKENPQFWRLDDETPTEVGYFGRAKKQEWLLIRWDARLDDYQEGKLNFNNNPIYRWESFNAFQRLEIKVALNVSVNYLTEDEIKWIVEEVRENPSIWRIGSFKGHNCLIHGLAQGNDNEIGTLIHSQQKFSDLEWKEINKAIIIQNISQWEFRDVIAFNGIFNDGMKLTKYDNERGEKVFIRKSVQIEPNDYDNQGNLLPQIGKIYREPDFNKEQWTEIQNAYDEMHPNYNNWTREQFIAEINRLKVENERLRNDRALSSSVKQERLQKNQQQLQQLQSYKFDSQPNNSKSSIPANLAIGGVLLVVVGLFSFLVIRKRRKNNISIS